MELVIKNLNFSYNEKLILKDINIVAKKNDIILIKGVNGSGKTTLLKCIGGIFNGGKKFDDIKVKTNQIVNKL